MLPGDTAFPAVLRLCVLPGEADFVFNALPCSETHLFIASFFLFYFAVEDCFKTVMYLRMFGLFLFVLMSFLLEKGLTRETWLLSQKCALTNNGVGH